MSKDFMMNWKITKKEGLPSNQNYYLVQVNENEEWFEMMEYYPHHKYFISNRTDALKPFINVYAWCEVNLAIAPGAECRVDPIEILISKYENSKRQQLELKKETPPYNAVQHQLLDQNIHIFNGIIKDLQGLL